MSLINKISIYYLIIAFLLLLYILGIFGFGLQKVFWQFFPAVLATTLAGAIFDYLELKRWSRPQTSLITGLIIGLIAQFGANPLVLSAIGISAMAIKFLVKLGSQHIFNPAGSGLLLGLVLFSSTPSWWVGGENPWIFLIWTAILLWKMKRWAPITGFLIPLVILNGINMLFSSSLLFFMSVMLIEPKTSPSGHKQGLIYGLIVAAGYVGFSNFTAVDPFIPSLIFGNLTRIILNRYS